MNRSLGSSTWCPGLFFHPCHQRLSAFHARHNSALRRYITGLRSPGEPAQWGPGLQRRIQPEFQVVSDPFLLVTASGLARNCDKIQVKYSCFLFTSADTRGIFFNLGESFLVQKISGHPKLCGQKDWTENHGRFLQFPTRPLLWSLRYLSWHLKTDPGSTGTQNTKHFPQTSLQPLFCTQRSHKLNFSLHTEPWKQQWSAICQFRSHFTAADYCCENHKAFKHSLHI